MPTAFIEVRSQTIRGTWPKCGPDCYVAVQIVPDGVPPLRTLRADVAEKRGIRVIRCGEGYSHRRGPRSRYAAAMAVAREIAAEVNGEEVRS